MRCVIHQMDKEREEVPKMLKSLKKNNRCNLFIYFSKYFFIKFTNIDNLCGNCFDVFQWS